MISRTISLVPLVRFVECEPNSVHRLGDGMQRWVNGGRFAAKALAEALSKANFQPSEIAVLHNATVEVAGDAVTIRLVLAEQLFKPVR